MDPAHRATVAAILRRDAPDPADRPAQAVALHSWVYRNVCYVPDPVDTEFIQGPRWTMRIGIGDCDDIAILLASLLAAAGFRWGFGLSSRSGSWPPDHVYAVVWDGSGWWPLDATLPDAGTVPPAAARWLVT